MYSTKDVSKIMGMVFREVPLYQLLRGDWKDRCKYKLYDKEDLENQDLAIRRKMTKFTTNVPYGG